MWNKWKNINSCVKSFKFWLKTQSKSNSFRKIKSLGDSLQATDSHQAQWGSPQNVRSTLKYPRAGISIGAYVTYVQIDIEQSTNLGRAYFIEGGIGQRRATIIIEAEQTLYYSYRAYIYGRNY